MQFKRTIFNIDAYGEKFKVKKLTASELNDYQMKLMNCKDNEAADYTFKMLSRQGIPKKITADMEFEHLQQLVGAVCGNTQGK
ncbi:MAG: hypothetical protein HRT70_08900 [Flavobacteriaceae bacterium]|nr:hypothetical protein [Flavobacteriaceae bacterium]